MIYISGSVADLPNVRTGDFHGDLTNELEEFGPDAYINEFVSDGSKNYAFSVFSSSSGTLTTKCKVKGITLNYTNS